MTPPARLRLWPTAEQLRRMARHPAAYAPTAAEVLTPGPVPPPTVAMCTQEQVLMDAILADPDADEPRLKYADWVEATDPDRGAFIRGQVVGLPRHAGERDAGALPCVSRLTALFAPWGARDLVFRRGFVEGMSLTGRCFVSLSDGLFAATPLREVRLIAVNFLMPELAACPNLQKLTRLDLRGNRIGDAGAKALATSPWLGNLKELDLTDNDLGPDGWAALRALPCVSR
jgi:uncharacterized protein (TIGR02996 family)